MGCLAAAGALAGLGGHRHRTAWQVAGLEGSLPILPEVRIAEGIPLLRAPREGEAQTVQAYGKRSRQSNRLI